MKYVADLLTEVIIPEKNNFRNCNPFLMNIKIGSAEGCQKYLYETMAPDIIVDMRIKSFYRYVALYITLLESEKTTWERN